MKKAVRKENNKELINTALKVLHLGQREWSYIRRYFQHAHFIPIVGVGKRGEY